jgi:hypothetical protein
MSPPVPTSRTSYPDLLEPIRSHVLSHLEPLEQRKLMNCHYKSQCRSLFCPSCLRARSHREKRRVLETAGRIPSNRLRFATFTVRDVPIDILRDTTQEIMQATRRTMAKLKNAHYAARLETSFESWNENYHPHAHVLLDSPPGGRNFTSADQWRDTWLSSLPSELHPREAGKGAHVEPVRDLEAACTYLTKSPFHAWVAENTARTLATIQTCKGIHKVTTRGNLAA